MRVVFTPETGDKREWEFTAGRIRSDVAEQIEKLAGINYGDWEQAVLDGNLRARRVLLWHLQSLEHPMIRFEDVSYYPDDLTVEPGLVEYGKLRAIAVNGMLAKGLTEADRAAMIAEIDRQIATLATVVDEGKEPSPDSPNVESSTD